MYRVCTGKYRQSYRHVSLHLSKRVAYKYTTYLIIFECTNRGINEGGDRDGSWLSMNTPCFVYLTLELHDYLYK